MSGGIASSSGQGTASPGLTIALVGLALTCGQGDLSASEENTRQLTGQEVVSSQGSVTAIRGKPLVTVSQGTAVVSSTVPLTGSAITGEQGTTTANADDNVQLIGLGAVVSAGTLEAYKSEALSGSEISSAIETIAPTLRPTDIEGQLVSSSQGTASASSDDVTAHLSGAEAAVLTGNFESGQTEIEGEEAVSSAGAATPSTTLALIGVTCSSVQGSLTAAQEASEDTFIVSASGSIVGSLAVALSGEEATGAQGTVGITGDVSTALTGEAATAAQGALLTDFGPALTGQAATGAQYFVGAPGGASLTGAEVATIAGTIYVTNDREYAISGVGASLAQGTLTPVISPALLGQSNVTGIGDFAAQPDRKALVGQVVTLGQGILRLPSDVRPGRGGGSWWPGGGKRRKTLREKLQERLEEVEEELLVQQPSKTPIFAAPPPVDAIKELQTQIINAVIQDQEQRSNNLPDAAEEEEIIEAAAQAMMMIIRRKRR